jgi:hypothetical protein
MNIPFADQHFLGLPLPAAQDFAQPNHRALAAKVAAKFRPSHQVRRAFPSISEGTAAVIHSVKARFVARLTNRLDLKKTLASLAPKKLFRHRIVKKIQIA